LKTGLIITVTLAGCLAGTRAAHTQPAAQPQSQQQDGQKAPATPPKPGEANPFPEDTTSVPVMPNATAPATGEPAWDGTNGGNVPVPGADNDPVRSPDEPANSTNSSGDESSSSLMNLDKVINAPDDERDKGRKKAPEHQETAADDESVGGYYLSTKNWKAALSRYQSALVLDPENPEVYWGLAEAQRHLGDLANAKANYSKVVEYDPDSKHGKEARKALKDPELANAPTSSAKPLAARP
jgi:tetratricopeptide (TPR) repeat protein